MNVTASESHTLRLSNKIFFGSMIGLFFSFAAAPLSYFIRILYSRTLTIEDYGLFYAVLALYTVLSTYNDLGFGFSVSYFVPKFIKKGDYQSAWNTYLYDQIIELSSSILISITLFLGANLLSTYYFKTPLASSLIIAFIPFFIFSSVLSAIERFYIGLQKELHYSSMKLMRLILQLAITFGFVIMHRYTVVYYALASSIAIGISSLMYYFLINKTFSKYSVKLQWNKQLFQQMFAFAWPTLANTSIGVVMASVDTFFLTLFHGLGAVGLYNVVVPIASISFVFLAPLNTLIFPLFSQLKEKHGEQISMLIQYLLRIIPFVAAYFALFILIFPGSLVQLLFGTRWATFSQYPLIVASIVFVFVLVTNLISNISNSLGLVKDRLKISVYAVLLNIVTSGFLIYYFGVTGAVLSIGLVHLFMLLLIVQSIKKIVFLAFPWVYYLKLLLVLPVIYFFFMKISSPPETWPGLITLGAVYTAIMFSIGLIIKTVNLSVLKLFLKSANPSAALAAMRDNVF